MTRTKKGKQKELVPGVRPAERALVLHPALRTKRAAPGRTGAGYVRNQTLKLEEAVGLARAIGLKVVASEVVDLARIHPGAFLGAGKVEQYAPRIEQQEIGLVVMDCTLSPGQQRNLERAWKTKVIDRTGLILEIFGERARTAEGTLQVELAHLTYQKSRLVRTWTHLERQRGGFGFMGGPGERQIEADRRQIQERITRIKKDLATVARRRALHRQARSAVPYPIVALAGYTNAGKSTLFNRLTGAAVEAGEQLFTTLDPTLRAVTLPGGRKVILSDTVGFISELPTELVAAFRATLEELREAGLILHVRDASNPEMAAQREDVLKVLKSLDIDPGVPVLELFNKIDLVPAEESEALTNQCLRQDRRQTLSALKGEGIETLLETMETIFAAGEPEVTITLAEQDGKARAWLHRHGKILAEGQADGKTKITVLLAEKHIGQFKKEFPDRSVTRGKTAGLLLAG